MLGTGAQNVRTRMCSPLHIRAPTRPLIFQCVTELKLSDLVASSLRPPPVVVVSNSVGVDCRATATDYRADDCAFLTTYRSTHCRTCSGANRRGQLVAVPVPKRSFFPIAAVITTSVVLIIPILRIRDSLVVSSAVVPPSVSCLSAGGDNRNH